VLTPQAVRSLFATLRRLASEGVSILYISHKLDEIRELCHRATVLRGGRVSGTAIPADETNDSLALLMVGRELPQCRLTPQVQGDVRLRLDAYSQRPRDPFGTALRGIDLAVHAGEIVGIAGVSGNGQRELLAAISGEGRDSHEGSIELCGRNAAALDPVQRRRLGFAFVPEERLGRGAVPALSLADNTLLTGARAGLVKLGFIKRGAARAFARRTIDTYTVKGTEHSLAGRLSGGNLQKFIVGREIGLAPRLMVAAQPTWGVDVGAAQLIRQALIDLRDRGVAVLVISEELDELFMICDRMAVIAGGTLSTPRPVAELTRETVGVLMSGGKAG
jgi:general nucleoside transport system ATP-binding protein